MVAWEKAKGKQTTGNQNKRDIERVTLGLGDTKLRLIGDVLPRYCYWVVTKDGKKIISSCVCSDPSNMEVSRKDNL